MIPEGFVAEMQELLGADEAGRLVVALQTEPVVGVRLNPLKPCELPAALEGERVPWCPEGRYLQGRPQFTLMPQLHAGGFYVQDPSSMIVAEVVRRLAAEIGRPMTALDACAAPGGKTTALLSALPEGSRLVANEFDPRRAQILVENMVKWGAPNLIVTQGDTARLRGLRQTFDLVLVDAPCSGEGMMRKDPAAREQWSQGLVRSCAAMQEEILDNIWPTLKPGGYLIYSTCTFNRLEDENQALRLISGEGAESMNLNMPAEWGIGASREQDLHALRFMPHITRGEGLFLTVLRKPGHLTEKPAKKRIRKLKSRRKP